MSGKRSYTLLALCLLFAACSKEEEKPTPRTYDLAGRVYERYNVSNYIPYRRTYYTLEFVDDTIAYKYQGTDLLGEDSVWHRKDTLLVDYFKPYLYSVTDVSEHQDVWDCAAYIDFYRLTTQTYPVNHEHNGETYISYHHYYTYRISDDEIWIWRDGEDDYRRVK